MNHDRLLAAADRLIAQWTLRHADAAIARFETILARGTVTYRPSTTRRAQVFRPVGDPGLRTGTVHHAR